MEYPLALIRTLPSKSVEGKEPQEVPRTGTVDRPVRRERFRMGGTKIKLKHWKREL